jgi:hypothetical protein
LDTHVDVLQARLGSARTAFIATTGVIAMASTSRMIADCRDFPSENGCTLTIAGEQGEGLDAAVAHAVSSHEHTDDEELRTWLLENMKLEVG